MSSSSSDENVEEDCQVVKKRKRGVRNEEMYSRNVIKMARLKGRTYTTKRGTVKPEVYIGPDCK